MAYFWQTNLCFPLYSTAFWQKLANYILNIHLPLSFLVAKVSILSGIVIWPPMGHFPGFLMSRAWSVRYKRLPVGVQKSSLMGEIQLVYVLFVHSHFILFSSCNIDVTARLPTDILWSWGWMPCVKDSAAQR